MMDDGSTEEKDYLEEALCEKSVMCSVGGGIFGVSKNVESVCYKQSQERCHRFLCSTYYYLPLIG